ncbi:MAG: S1 family peptidase [Planctomycetota bacterium]
MNLRTTVGAALIVALLAGAPLAAEDKPAEVDWAKLMASKAPSIVSVKFVLKIQMSFMGQSRDQERNSEVRGVLVNDTGLVLTSNSHFDPGSAIPRQMRSQVEIKGTPTELKVLFGNEEEEYEGQIVARDSNLSLAFVQVLDLKDRKVTSVDLAAGGEIALGQELFGVGRLPRGFDCAPTIGRAFVSAKVEKPRTMWAISGSFSAVGLPVFDKSARPVGIVSMQHGSEGVDEGAAVRPFLLPLATVLRTMKAAETRAAEALEEAKKRAEEEAEAEEERAEAGGAEAGGAEAGGAEAGGAEAGGAEAGRAEAGEAEAREGRLALRGHDATNSCGVRTCSWRRFSLPAWAPFREKPVDHTVRIPYFFPEVRNKVTR